MERFSQEPGPSQREPGWLNRRSQSPIDRRQASRPETETPDQRRQRHLDLDLNKYLEGTPSLEERIERQEGFEARQKRLLPFTSQTDTPIPSQDTPPSSISAEQVTTSKEGFEARQKRFLPFTSQTDAPIPSQDTPPSSISAEQTTMPPKKRSKNSTSIISQQINNWIRSGKISHVEEINKLTTT